MGDKHSAGKGDRYRAVDMKKFSKNWDSIFKKQKSAKKICSSKKK